MPNFRRVKTGLADNERGGNEEKKHEKLYRQKVGKLRDCCSRFGRSISLGRTTNHGKKYIVKPKDWQGKFQIAFNNKSEKDAPMKANKLTSRTSRVLHDIYKKLSKIKDEEFDVDKVNEYKEAFSFKAKSSNGEYIKRSAIDDPAVARYFTGKGSTTVKIEGNLKDIPDFIDLVGESVTDQAPTAAISRQALAKSQSMKSKSQDLTQAQIISTEEEKAEVTKKKRWPSLRKSNKNK